MTASKDDAPLGQSFFAGRVLVEILTWEWALHVHTAHGAEPLFQRSFKC